MQFSLVISHRSITFFIFWLSRGSVATLIRWGGWSSYHHASFIVKSNTENCTKIRWTLTKLQTKISWLLFYGSLCIGWAMEKLAHPTALPMLTSISSMHNSKDVANWQYQMTISARHIQNTNKNITITKCIQILNKVHFILLLMSLVYNKIFRMQSLNFYQYITSYFILHCLYVKHQCAIFTWRFYVAWHLPELSLLHRRDCHCSDFSRYNAAKTGDDKNCSQDCFAKNNVKITGKVLVQHLLTKISKGMFRFYLLAASILICIFIIFLQETVCRQRNK